ncbi:MAG: FAD-dependent oxidoreductase [Paludibaculum sp.]
MKNLKTTLVVLASFCALLPAQRLDSYDVVVIGATPAGIAAAIQAGRAKLSVALVEEMPVPGGLLTSGVSRADDAMVQSVSGVFEDFRRRIAHYHRTELANDPVVKAQLAAPKVRHSVPMGQAWEPKVGVMVYRKMLAEHPSIQTYYREVPVAAKLEGDRVVAVVTKDAQGTEHTYRGRAVIDATYEGDVAAFAGVPYDLGREARSPEQPMRGKSIPTCSAKGSTSCPAPSCPVAAARATKRSWPTTTGSW